MKHTSKRILSVLICLAMVLSLLSVVSFAAAPSILYLKPNSNWTQANARFAAYFFNNSTGKNTWASCTAVAGAGGVYQVEVPDGFPNVIFCRMNPSSTKDDWNNKWNQTGDLTIPTDGKNCFTVKSGAWDGATTTWETYTPPACKHPSHGQDGKCTACGDVVPHSFKDGVCTVCAAADPDYTDITVYCINSANWSEVAAYAWTEGGAGLSWPGELMTKTENTVNGFDVYEITFHYAYEKVIFNNNDKGSQTADLALMAGQYFDLQTATWYASLEEVPTVDPLATDWYLAGSMNEWNTTDTRFMLAEEGATTASMTLELEAATTYEFKLVNAGTWTGCATEITGTTEGLVFSADVQDNAKLTTTEAAEYVLTLDVTTGTLSVTYPVSTEPTCEHPSHSQEGICDECGEPVAHSYDDNFACACGAKVSAVTIYFRNDWNWSNVTVYYWGSVAGDTSWPGVAMELNEETGIYSKRIPADASFLFHGIDGETEKQSPDIKEGIAEGNCYYMSWSEELGEHVLFDSIENILAACEHPSHSQEGICDECGEPVDHVYTDGTCSCGKTVIPATYTVAGVGSLCGTDWDSTDTNNQMIDVDGTFTIVYQDVAAAEGYEFKVVEAIEGSQYWYGNGEDNVIFNVTDTCDVTVTFDPETKEITVTGEYVKLPGSELEVAFITAAGNGDDCWLNGVNWDSADESNRMTEISENVYQITYTNVECYDNYQVKFVADGSWQHNWGGTYTESGVAAEAVYNAYDNITVVVPYELANVTLTLDLSNYDHITKSGATFTVTVEEIVSECAHENHDQDGNCSDCGVYVGHSFDDNNTCACGKTIELINVYFRNNWKWSEINVYYWGSELTNPDWPGEAVTYYGTNGTDDVYVATVPSDISGLIINGTNPEGSEDKTPDITEFSDGICYYMEWADGNLALTQTLEEAMACPHNIIHVEAVAATCYENGNIEYWYCDACGQAWLDEACTLNTNLKAVILPMAHGEIIHVEAVAPTCYEDGNIEYWYCEACGQAWLDEACTQNTNLKAVVLPMTHGEITHVEAVAPTCYEDGNLEYWYCEACGQAWLDEACTQNTNLMAVVLPVSHNVIYVEAADATCYENGNVEYWYCDACGQAWLDELCHLNTNLKAVILPSQGHSFADGFCGICGEADPDYEVPSEPEEPVVQPTKVEGLTCTDTTRNTISLSWDAVDGAVKYWVYVNGGLYTATKGTSVVIEGRKVNTEYSIYVIANFDDATFMLAEDADVIDVTTDDYVFWSYTVEEDNTITTKWTAEDCTKAWFYYGYSADDLVLYASSTDGTFVKANLKEATYYYVQVAYFIDGRVVYGDVEQVITEMSGYIPV